MYKYIIGFLFFALPVFSQQNLNAVMVDSLSYNYYVNGKWSELIALGNEAVNQGLNFKYLQQRMGYASFVQGNYYSSIKYYQNSLKFDAHDEVSRAYLYYAAVKINDEKMARFQLSKTDTITQRALGVKKTRPVDAVDLEYNYKISDYAMRGNPTYKRIGLNSLLGYRFSLYQTYSTYNQITELTNQTVQNEYFVSGIYSVFSRTNLTAAYHYVGTKYNTATDSLSMPGNMWYGSFSHSFNRFDLSLSYSSFTNAYNVAHQTGLQVGFVLPTPGKIYLKSSLYNIADSTSSRLVFNQTIGTLILNRFWLQAGVTLGNLNNFVDNNGLYLYNSMDYTIFRTGASLFCYLGKHLTLFTNYSYDKKQTADDTQYIYNQHSITGGLIWKL